MNKRTLTRTTVHDKYDGRCAYCGTDIAFKDMQVDHYFPLWSPELAKAHNVDLHDISNLMPSCRKCNHYKRGDLPEDFREKIKSIHERVEKIYIFQVAYNFNMTHITPFDGKFYFEIIRDREFPCSGCNTGELVLAGSSPSDKGTITHYKCSNCEAVVSFP